MHSPPRYLAFCFQSFQGFTTFATENLVSVSLGWYMLRGTVCESWVLSTPLRSNLFLKSTDYTTQLRNLCRDLLYPEKEQVTLSKDKGNNTNHCVAERGNLRKLALTGYVLLLSTTAARVGRWTQILSSWRHSSGMKCTLSTNGIICMWDQWHHPPPPPIYAMLP